MTSIKVRRWEIMSEENPGEFLKWFREACTEINSRLDRAEEMLDEIKVGEKDESF